MTNLEFYKDDILRETIKNDNLVCAICKEKYKKCINETDEQCPFEKDLLLWLCEEYKEPIKLKQWEYDLINEYIFAKQDTFDDFAVLSRMKNKGYFKGLNDKNMICQEILSNCIIVSDDYDFGGDE